jgi:drug/metabolite transporter (DMT)-like permease
MAGKRYFCILFGAALGISLHSIPEKQKAVLYLILTASLWSLGGILIKLVHWHPAAIAGGRSAIAAIVMWAVLRRPHFTWSGIQIGGAVAYTCTVMLFVLANKLTTAANAILLQYTGPVWVALFGAWFLGEKTTRLDWITILIVFGGMILFFQDGLSTQGMSGNWIAIASGIAFAALALCLRRQKDGSPAESILLGNILTAMIGLPFMLASPIPDQQSVMGIILLGTIQLGLPYLLYAKAARSVTALEAVLIPVLEPLLNPLWVFLAAGEKPGPWSMAGGIIVIMAVTGRSVIMSKVRHK